MAVPIFVKSKDEISLNLDCQGLVLLMNSDFCCLNINKMYY